MDIDLVELKKITDSIFDHVINDLNIKTLPITEGKDFYWDHLSADRHDMSNTPQPVVGRLSDDLGFLLPLLQNNDQAVALMFVHAAALIRYIGEEVGC